MQRSVLQAKQDAQEQKAKIDWLTFRGPHVIIENHETMFDKKSEESQNQVGSLDKKLARHIAGMISKRIDIDINEENGDITYAGIRGANENHPKFLLVRFQQQSMRDEIWRKRKEGKKNGIIIEEWLTDHRARLYKKCKELKSAKNIKDVITENGDVYAILPPTIKEYNGRYEINQEGGHKNGGAENNQELLNMTDLRDVSHVTHDTKITGDSQTSSRVKFLVISDGDYENLVKLTKKAKVDQGENMGF